MRTLGHEKPSMSLLLFLFVLAVTVCKTKYSLITIHGEVNKGGDDGGGRFSRRPET